MNFSKTALEAPSAGSRESGVQLFGLGDTLATFAPLHRLPTEQGFFMEEIWKDVVGYEGHYEVSSLGRMRRISKGRVRYIKPCITKRHGYYSVKLSVNAVVSCKTLHSVVAAAFVGQRPDGHDVNHIDANKLNNSASNLEYTTRKRNLEHAIKSGLIACGEKASGNKITIEVVDKILEIARRGGRTQQSIADEFGLSVGHTNEIINGKVWKRALQERNNVG